MSILQYDLTNRMGSTLFHTLINKVKAMHRAYYKFEDIIGNRNTGKEAR